MEALGQVRKPVKAPGALRVRAGDDVLIAARPHLQQVVLPAVVLQVLPFRQARLLRLEERQDLVKELPSRSRHGQNRPIQVHQRPHAVGVSAPPLSLSVQGHADVAVDAGAEHLLEEVQRLFAQEHHQHPGAVARDVPRVAADGPAVHAARRREGLGDVVRILPQADEPADQGAVVVRRKAWNLALDLRDSRVRQAQPPLPGVLRLLLPLRELPFLRRLARPGQDDGGAAGAARLRRDDLPAAPLRKERRPHLPVLPDVLRKGRHFVLPGARRHEVPGCELHQPRMARNRLRPHREGDLPLAPVLHADPHEEPRPIRQRDELALHRQGEQPLLRPEVVGALARDPVREPGSPGKEQPAVALSLVARVLDAVAVRLQGEGERRVRRGKRRRVEALRPGHRLLPQRARAESAVHPDVLPRRGALSQIHGKILEPKSHPDLPPVAQQGRKYFSHGNGRFQYAAARRKTQRRSAQKKCGRADTQRGQRVV